MTPLEMIAEWRKGCTCGGPVYDQIMGNQPGTTRPAYCEECTDALVNALEAALTDAAAPAPAAEPHSS